MEKELPFGGSFFMGVSWLPENEKRRVEGNNEKSGVAASWSRLIIHYQLLILILNS